MDNVWIISVLFGLVQAWFFYDKKRTDAEIKDLNKNVNKNTESLSNLSGKQQHYATHSEVRELIRESIEPLRNDQRETKDLAREINTSVNQLARDIAVLNVLRGLENGKNKDIGS